MIFAGNCLLSSTDEQEIINIIETAKQLNGIVDVFRCKIFGGGTIPEKYKPGIGFQGLFILAKIQKEIMPVATEIQTETQLKICNDNIDCVSV